MPAPTNKLILPAAGILLCGGHSQRMGRAKWSLPFGTETMLDRIARSLSKVVATLIVVGPNKGEMPQLAPLPYPMVFARDRVADRGPLEGLAVGLALAAERGIAYALATACDTPLLQPTFVRRMLELASGYDAAVPRTAEGDHPLPAVYASRLVDDLELLLAEGERRAGAFARQVHSRWVEAEDLADVDPEMLSLCNVNTPEDYAAALRSAL